MTAAVETRDRRALRHTRTPSATVVVMAVLVCLLSSLVQAGHGDLDVLELVALVARVVAVVTGAAVLGTILVHLLTPDHGPVALDPSAAAWARTWVGALAVSFLVELVSPASVAARAALGPDASAAAARMRWLVAGLGLAALVCLLCATVRTRADARLLLGLTAAGVIVAGGSGHGGSVLALSPGSTALAVHVLAASAWVGGLLALVLRTPDLARAGLLRETAGGYSRLALVCYAALATSGLVTLTDRTSLDTLLDSGPYLALITAKTALLVLLGAAGHVQRRASLSRLADGHRRTFLLVSAGELVAMATAVGLAVTVTHTAA